MTTEVENSSNLAELFVSELKKILPQDQLEKLGSFDLSSLKSIKNHEVSYICAKWAIDTTSDEKHSEFGHLVSKIKEIFKTVKETEWEARVALEMSSMSVLKGMELAGVNEALDVIENIGKSKGFDQTSWDNLLSEIVAKSKS